MMKRYRVFAMLFLVAISGAYGQENLDPDALDQLANQPVSYDEFGRSVSRHALRVAADEIRKSGKKQESISVNVQLVVTALEDPLTKYCRTEVCARFPDTGGLPCVAMCVDPLWGELESPPRPAYLIPADFLSGENCDRLWEDFRNDNAVARARAWQDLVDAGCVVWQIVPMLPALRD